MNRMLAFATLFALPGCSPEPTVLQIQSCDFTKSPPCEWKQVPASEAKPQCGSTITHPLAFVPERECQ